MFVKVITDEDNLERKAELLYECSKAFLHTKNETTVYLTLSTGSDTEQLELTKKTTAIYMMNEDGKTISNHRWQ